MQVVESVAALRQARRALMGSVGFVPTMGYLHEGHLSLVRAARAENDHTVVSIFINPAQFGPQEDYATYPRDPQRDLALLEQEGVALVFLPALAEIYPPGFSTFVHVEKIAEPLEGVFRPGHFRGVATVVAKLFNLVQPQRAYLGQKDAQQAAVIRKLVADLNLDLELRVLPTVREPDGLALSSRNVYLSPQERQAALVLYRSLQQAEALWREGERRAEALRQAMRALIAAEPLARPDYVSVAHPDTMEELEEISGPALVSLAVHIGRTRLIDNILLSFD